MNIIFLFFHPFDPQIGGVERVTDILTRELQALGYHVDYLCFQKMDDITRCAADVYYFPSENDYITEQNKKFYVDFIRTHKIDICVLQEPRFSMSIFELFPEDNCKLISVYHGSPVGDLNNYWKCLMQKHTFARNYYPKLIPRLLRKIIFGLPKLKQHLKRSIDHALSVSDAVVYLSKNYEHDFSILNINSNKDKIKYIGNPLNYKPLHKLPDKEKLVLFVGRLVPLKQPDLLISMMGKILSDFPDWKFCIIGDGPMMEYCKYKAKRIKNIIFTGQCDPEEYYSRASILCMASNNEGWPMVLMEAMCKGCVPIAFNSFAAVSEIIEDGKNGVLVKSFKRQEYENKLRKLLSDNTYRNRLANNALFKMNLFTADVIVQKWIYLFNEVMK